jgi:AraC-like DNA-binding protein
MTEFIININNGLISTGNMPPIDNSEVRELGFTINETEMIIQFIQRRDGRLKVADKREEERFYNTIQQAITENLSMDEMAQRCCVSLSTFKRRFKEWIGGSPHEWIIAKRMELAHKILRERDITISSLAKLCGYNNVSHFIEVFKKHYNITPHMLRKQLSEKKKLTAKDYELQ